MQNNKITCEKKKVKARIKHKKGLAESKQGQNEKRQQHIEQEEEHKNTSYCSVICVFFFFDIRLQQIQRTSKENTKTHKELFTNDVITWGGGGGGG